MTNITLRGTKGSALTNDEVDSNFSGLNDFKVEQSDSTGSALIPSGTDAQRDGSPSEGMLRHSTTDNRLEVYTSSAWNKLSTGQVVETTSDVTLNNITSNGWVDLKHDSATAPPHSEGRLYYDQQWKALSYRNDISDVSLQVGLEDWIRVYNNTGSSIPNGTPVYITGAVGETPTIAPADATTENKARAVGLTTHDIINAAEGIVTARGLVADVNTSGLTAGSAFHLAPDGSLQEAAPTYPYFPTELGHCVVSDSNFGYLYIHPIEHTYEQFRVTGNQRVDGDMTVGGDLTILGTQSIASVNNLKVDTSFIYSNSGDTIGDDNTDFTGSGLNDAILTGHFEGTASTSFYARIDGVGAGTGGVDTFEWALDSDFTSPVATDVDITGNNQDLQNGIEVNFNATTGHTLNDRWFGTAAPVNVDVGFASNRNTGGSGVGYTHVGLFFDVTDEKWKLFKEYDPEPNGTINIGHASYGKATLDADITGDVTGDLTGAVTGNASTATALETARNIGGVSFDGTGNIDLAGVNTTGNQNTSGSAATLTTARNIGGVSFNGSANIDLPGVNTAGNQATSGNAATATALETARNIGGVSFDGTGNINLPGVNTVGNQNTSGSAATLTTARNIGGVSFNGSANITLPGVNAAGNQATSGNAATATALETARNFSLTGHVTASAVSFDGTGNAALSTLLDLSVLTDMTDDVVGSADEIILLDDGAERRKAINEIKLGQFNNDQGWTSNVGDITGVTAGTGLSGGGASGSVSLNVSGLTSTQFAATTTLLIKNAAGTTLKTMRSPST